MRRTAYQAATAFCAPTSPRRAEVIIASAGAGKTYTAAAKAKAWQAGGIGRVIGLALTSAGRNGLAAAGVPECYSLAEFLGHAILCPTMKELRFGVVSESVREGRGWLDFARQVEDAGIDVLLLRDHFSAGAFGQQLAPFTGLAAAAAVTMRLRLGTIVLSNDFRHPAVLAHEAASLHLVSAGRFELGIGAGWYQPEYDAAGIAFDAAGRRISRLDESLGIIKGLLAGTPVHHRGDFYRIDGLNLDVLPVPRPSSPRLLVGAGGPRMLRLAARHADIVGMLPAPIRDSTDSEDPQDRLPAAFDAKLAVVREAAGDRFGDLEISAFGTFVVTGKRRAETEDMIARRGWTGIDVEAVWQMPTIFIGSPDQIRADLRARRERFGLSYLVVGEDKMPALAEIVSGA